MTTLTRIKPAPVESSLPTLRNEMNRLIDDAFRFSGWHPGPDRHLNQVSALAALDVVETTESYEVTAEVPGLAAEDIDIQVEGTSLTIRGTKRPPVHEPRETLRRERVYGPFCRTVTLPGSIEPDGVSAACEQGVVTVSVPKSAAARARRIEVTEAT